MDYYSKYLKYKTKYLNLIGGSDNGKYVPPQMRNVQLGPQGPPIEDQEVVVQVNIRPRPIQTNIIIFHHSQAINYWRNVYTGLNRNITLSTCNNHIPRYAQHIGNNNGTINVQPFDFTNIFNNHIGTNKYLICAGNNRSTGGYRPDLQLGITEKEKEDETIYETASRGIYEETGLYITKEYIQNHNYSYILLHRTNRVVRYKLGCHLIIIDGSTFFRENNLPNYNYHNNYIKANNADLRNSNDVIQDALPPNFENNIRNVHILLIGDDRLNIINKMNAIDSDAVATSLLPDPPNPDTSTRDEYLQLSTIVLPTNNLLNLFTLNTIDIDTKLYITPPANI